MMNNNERLKSEIFTRLYTPDGQPIFEGDIVECYTECYMESENIFMTDDDLKLYNEHSAYRDDIAIIGGEKYLKLKSQTVIKEYEYDFEVFIRGKEHQRITSIIIKSPIYGIVFLNPKFGHYEPCIDVQDDYSDASFLYVINNRLNQGDQKTYCKIIGNIFDNPSIKNDYSLINLESFEQYYNKNEQNA